MRQCGLVIGGANTATSTGIWTGDDFAPDVVEGAKVGDFYIPLAYANGAQGANIWQLTETGWEIVVEISSQLLYAASVTALRALDVPQDYQDYGHPAAPTLATTPGSDGQPVLWVYSTTSTAADDGALAVKPSSITGAGRWLALSASTGIQSVATVAALKALTVSGFQNGKTFILRGYYTDGDDGGGAMYRYSPSSVATADNGSVIAPNAGAGRYLLLRTSEKVNAKWWGAKGDATYRFIRADNCSGSPTDDATAMQSAITYCQDNGVPLYIPPGMYRIGSPLVIKKGWATYIYGYESANPGYDQVLANPSCTPNGTGTGTDALHKTTVLIRDFDGTLLTIHGLLNASTDPDKPYYTVGNANCNTGTRIFDVGFFARAGVSGGVTTAPLVSMKRIYRGRFERCLFFNSYASGLELRHVDDSRFVGCVFYVCGFGTNVPAVVLHRTNTISGEDQYQLTNTLHFDHCTFEGNPGGNFHVSESDNGSAAELFFTACSFKIVNVATNGIKNLSFTNSNGVYFTQCAAGMRGLSGGPFTATELIKFKHCVNVRYDGEIGMATGASLSLDHYITVEDSNSVDLRLQLVGAGPGKIADGQYVVLCTNATPGTNLNTSIRVSGGWDNPIAPTSLYLCNMGSIEYGQECLIGMLVDADFNSTSDQRILINTTGNARFRVTKTIFENQSTSLTNAVGGIFTSTGGGGTVIVPAATAYASLNASFKLLEVSPPNDFVIGNNVFYLTLTTPQGSPATCNVWVYGIPL